jgi:tetratricopeptide (TPR) repeat protein
MKKLAWTLAAATLAVASPSFADEPAASPHGELGQDEAREHHRRGLELFDEGDLKLALVEFERAYALAPGYKLLFNIGQVYFQLNAYAKARTTLERYLREGGDQLPPQRREAVERDLATLRTRTAYLTIHTNVPGAEITIDEVPIGKAPLDKLLVDAGPRRIVVSAPGRTSRVESVALAGGDERTLEVSLVETRPQQVVVAPPARESPLRVDGPALAGWISTGVLALGAIGTGIAAEQASSTYDAKLKRPVSGSVEAAQSDLDRQRSLLQGLALTTDILIGATLVAGGVSTYLTLREKPKPGAPRVRVQGLGASFEVGF